MTEETLFDLVRKTPETGRQTLLGRACADNPELQARVEALLKADDASSPLSKQPIAIEATTGFEATHHYTSSDPTPGIIIANRYTLVERIGEGGMGEVWVAKQSEPVKRRVALKLIKAGMDSKSVLQRFEQERQALALMDHPNIAKVLDGGLTQDRRPYFVMELVNGAPLTKFCDDAKLGIRERLEIFIPICQAVQHAHQKGIVHRDLKPSNILITIIDGKPIPKIIDFGVAKATSGRLTEESLSTQFGAVVGTLEYMSPEQAGFSGEDIDTRADIYSLGVILYELLTGLRPIDAKRLKKAALTEMIRIIKEEEPSKPSTRLSTDDSAPSMAALRHTEPKKLSSLLRGELDWVVMKALEKDRNRRYETANGLARDIQRYLSDEVVEARPPSAGYRLSKFVRRNKGQVIAASLVICTLLAGIVGTSWGLMEARSERDEKEKARQAEVERAEGERLAKMAAQESAKQEKAARLEEEKQRKVAEAITRFVHDDFLALTSVEGQVRFGGAGKEALTKDTTLRELLDRAAEKLRARKDLDPRIEAELCLMVGVNYRGMGESEKGIEFLERAVQLREGLFGRDHFDTQDAMNSLAVTYGAAGHSARAVPLLEETLRYKKNTLGLDASSTIVTMDNLAHAYLRSGKLERAITLGEETFKLSQTTLGPTHTKTLYARSNLARAYEAKGKYELALPLCEETLKLRKATLAPEHPDTLTNMNDLAGLYLRVGKRALALPLYEETLKLKKARLGLDHPDTLVSMNDLASAYEESGKLNLALPLFEETRKLQTAKLGTEHPHVLSTMNNLAMAYLAVGKPDVAVPLLEETLKVRKAKHGLEIPETLACMTNLAGAYHAAKRLDLALPLFEETLKLKRATLGADHPLTITCMNGLAGAYVAAGKHDLALPLDEEMLKHRKAKLGPDHPDTLGSMGNLAKGYCDTNQVEKGVAIFKEFVAGERKRAKPDDLRFAGELAKVALELLKCKQHVAAEEVLRECLAIRVKTQPDAWTTFNTQSLLGGALLGQKKYAEAEPLLLKGCVGMKAREKTIPPQGIIRLSEALDRLIQLYTKTNKPAEVKKWQAEKEILPKSETIKK